MISFLFFNSTVYARCILSVLTVRVLNTLRSVKVVLKGGFCLKDRSNGYLISF